LVTFTMVNFSNVTQNLVKHRVNLDAYWCNVAFNYISSLTKVNDYNIHFALCFSLIVFNYWIIKCVDVDDTLITIM
jgi:hypothetical protein